MLGYKVMQSGVNAFSVQAICADCTTGIPAAGTVQGDATALAAAVNFVGTVAASTGVVLPALATGGDCVFIFNGGANPLKVYPDSGAKVNGLPANTPFTLAPNTAVEVWRGSATQWAAVLSA